MTFSYQGLDYDKEKLLHMDSIEAERLNRKKKKKNPDTGFADYEQATARQYNSLIKRIKPDMEKYEENRKKLGAAFYGDKNTILHGLQEDKKESIDRMVKDLEEQYVKFITFDYIYLVTHSRMFHNGCFSFNF